MAGSVACIPNSECLSSRNEFLHVQCGDFVAVEFFSGKKLDWWVGRVLSRIGNSQDPLINTLFQVIDVDTGKVKIVNANLVLGILMTNK